MLVCVNVCVRVRAHQPEKGVPVVDFVSGTSASGHPEKEQNMSVFFFSYDERGVKRGVVRGQDGWQEVNMSRKLPPRLKLICPTNAFDFPVQNRCHYLPSHPNFPRLS